MRPETAVTSEHQHKQTCFKLSASGLTDVKTDINTDRSENSATRNTSEILEQSVLGEGSIVRPETAVTSERHHEQTCFKLSARPTPAIVIVNKTDVNTDINTDRLENSAPRNFLEIFEQAVLGERSSVRPEAADVLERHQERTCFKLSTRPTTVMGIVHKTDANTDINVDRPDNSDPGSISDVNLFKCGVQDTQEGQPMEGITKSRQEDQSGFELAVASTDKERLPTSYTLERSESIISKSQSHFQEYGGFAIQL